MSGDITHTVVRKGDGMGIIYQCTNLINQKIYIGQTKQTLEKRKASHLRTNDNTIFHKAIRKYGKENFYWEVLGEYDDDKLDYWENFWIEEKESFYTLGKGYNMTKGDPPSKTTTNKKVQVYIKDLNEKRIYYSLSEAARELTKEFYPKTFSYEYISKICHGNAYAYYKNFFFNFLDENDQPIPTNYIDKRPDGYKKMVEKRSTKIFGISPDGEERVFVSLTQAGKETGVDRHLISNGLRNSGIYKNKGWTFKYYNSTVGGS